MTSSPEHGSTMAKEKLSRELEKLQTENKELLRSLNRLEEQFAGFMQTSPNACAILDEDFRFIRVNNAGARLLGEKGPSEALGTRLPRYPPGEDPEGLMEGYRSVLQEGKTLALDSVPLKGGSETLFFDIRAFKIGTNLGLIWMDVTRHREQEQQLLARQRKLGSLVAHLLETREEEQKNYARELHDELGQILTAIDMEVCWIARQHPHIGAEARQRIEDLRSRVKEAINALHKVSSELRPSVLDHLGLGAAIDWLIQDFSLHGLFKLRSRISIREETINDKAATAIFRILQEALTNAARHSKASVVEVILTQQRGQLRLAIRDNGIGLSASQASDPTSFGLLGIQERARALGGTAEIDGSPGQGTRIRVSIPTGRTDSSS